MPECDPCGRYFSSWHSYFQHMNTSVYHNFCPDCNIDFSTWTGLKEHWVQSPRHSYCQQCSEHFEDQDHLEDHYDNAHFWCRSCRHIFKNEFGLKEHYRQSPRHHYCAACNRLFMNANNLNAHMNSSTHRPKDIICPTRCGAKFVSHSALVLHLENGACSSGINRNTVNRVVRQYDTNNLITDPARLIGESPGMTQNVKMIATSASWNGRGFECYICYKVHSSLNALNQHLASPRHEDEIYICRGPSCGQRFRILSAFVAHIESQKCGISKFKQVQSTMDSVLGQMGRLTL